MDVTLARVFATWSSAGHWALAWDDAWRYVAISDEMALSGAEVVIDEFIFGPANVEVLLGGSTGGNSVDEVRSVFMRQGRWLLADLGGDRDVLREMVHPVLRDLVDELEPCDDEAFVWEIPTTNYGNNIGAVSVYQRVRDVSGRVVGGVCIAKPAVA